MPATIPPIAPDAQHRLASLGERIRVARKRQRVSAVAAAQAAGISRVTLHRIERGETVIESNRDTHARDPRAAPDLVQRVSAKWQLGAARMA